MCGNSAHPFLYYPKESFEIFRNDLKYVSTTIIKATKKAGFPAFFYWIKNHLLLKLKLKCIF